MLGLKKYKVTSFVVPMGEEMNEVARLTSLKMGWGNGYVVLPPNHPCHGMFYDEIDIETHGGLTFSAHVNELDWSEVQGEHHPDGWVIGFDTGHCYDDEFKSDESYVRDRTEKLRLEMENFTP